MTGRVTGTVEDVEAQIETLEADAVTAAQCEVATRDTFRRRTVDRDVELPDELRHAADVIAVMMGHQDSLCAQFALRDVRHDRRRVSGVHDRNA